MEKHDKEQKTNSTINASPSSQHATINNTTSNNSSPVHSINSPLSSPSPSPSPSRHSSDGFSLASHRLTEPAQQQQQQHHEHQQSSPSTSPEKTTAAAATKKMSSNNNVSSSSLSPHLSPVFIPSKSVRDKPAVMTKVNDSNSGFDFPATANGEDHDRDHLDGGGGGGELGGVGRNIREPKTKRTVRAMGESMKRKAFLGFRISGMILCLTSFSIMATDKHQGWALDSFDRYKELRYCLAVNVIGFVYSAAQTSVVVYDMATGNYKPHNRIHNHFDFFMDQVLSYLLISASSSAATRVDDWTSNWGEDKFTQTATASIALSFLAFVALASSSLLSGFTLFTLRPM